MMRVVRARAVDALGAELLMDLVGMRLGPAVGGALLAASHTGDAAQGILVGAGILAWSQLLGDSAFSLGARASTRLALAVVAGALGVASAFLVSALAGEAIRGGELLTALSASWLLLAVGFWNTLRVERTTGGLRYRVMQEEPAHS